MKTGSPANRAKFVRLMKGKHIKELDYQKS